jgi:hypothetical protein
MFNELGRLRFAMATSFAADHRQLPESISNEVEHKVVSED